MEVEKDRGRDDSKCSEERSYKDGDEEERETLPGFRFHPTDEELVGFYLKRKVEKRLLRLELIKHVDIYKYDPWDLPRLSTVRDKEWYFFCIRGRKYRNSIRPNRVTGSGFWKATGIDKPIYSAKEPHDCIGLKKSLVYYRGSAGKGTKTDWMMHEFRLPTSSGKSTLSNLSTAKSIAQEAEVWTLCRIFKRIPTHRKYTSNLKENTINQKPADSGSKTDSLESSDQCPELNVSFRDSAISRSERKPLIMDHFDERNYLLLSQFNSIAHAPFTATSYSGLWNLTGDQELYGRGNSWDELRSVVERAVDPCQAFDWI